MANATPLVISQQASQSSLVSQMADPVSTAFGLLDTQNPSSFDSFLVAIKALIRHFGLASGTRAAKAYVLERKAAGVTGSFQAHPAPTATPDKIESSVRWATKDLWTPNPDIEAARINVTGVAEKNVLDTGRLTTIQAVQADRKAKGWARETEPGCCSFCALLATRGAVYKSEDTADFQSHDHCRCFAVPVFTAYEPPAQVRQWQQLYKDSTKGVHGPKASRAAFRKAFESQ